MTQKIILADFLMRAPHIKVCFCLCFLFIVIETSIAQERNPTKFPFGGIDSLEWLIFKGNANFGTVPTNVQLVIPTNSNIFITFIAKYATFDNSANFAKAIFHKEANFAGATFHKEANFGRATFDGSAHFWKATFNSSAEYRDATFDSIANFFEAIFHKEADFMLTTFNGDALFIDATFDGSASFFLATFHKKADFNRTTFHKKADFNKTTFHKKADFSLAVFECMTIFQNVVFKGTVDFSNTTFSREIDFRETNFNSVDYIYLDGITFPEGKFRIYWEQFKGKDNLRIKLVEPLADSIKDEQYTRIEVIYNKLRDNFLAQGNKSSADNVMYELGWQRDEILHEFWWGVYGTLFGYGYQPWRFLLFIVAPLIILFAIIWYWFYYTLLVFINPSIFPKIVDASSLRTKEKQFIKIKNIIDVKLPVTNFDITLKNANRLTRYWHAIFFSASVLLGIRFKKDWTTVLPTNMVGRKTFIYFVTLEWILGIGLFIVFALLVKGIRFSFIKDLLGF